MSGAFSSAELARKAEADARAAVNAIESAAFDAGQEAAKAAVAAYSKAHDLSGARERLVAAARARVEAEDNLPPHEWDGQRVYRMERANRWSDCEKRVEGIVETRRSSTTFPGNVAYYRLPNIGEGFVRLFKADGSAGARFEKLGLLPWQLAETPNPNTPSPKDQG